jgi:hypothetical protein
MLETEIHLGDVGTTFVLIVKDNGIVVDLSSNTGLTMYFRPVAGALLTRNAVLSTDGYDGKMQYTTVAGDLSVSGLWEIQGYIQFGSNSWKTEVKQFQVYTNIG